MCSKAKANAKTKIKIVPAIVEYSDTSLQCKCNSLQGKTLSYLHLQGMQCHMSPMYFMTIVATLKVKKNIHTYIYHEKKGLKIGTCSE